MERLHLIGHPLNFYTFHLYIKCILHISFILVLLYWLYSNDLFLVFYKKLTKPPKSPLRLVNLNNTCPIRFTAAAGTNLAGTFTYFIITIFLLVPGLTYNSSYYTSYLRSLARSHFMHCPIFFTAAFLVQALSLARCGWSFVKTS